MPNDYGINEDLYDDKPMKPKGESVDEQERKEMEEKAVVPLKLLKGKHLHDLKEGDEIVVKINSIHGDEAVISYAEGKGGEGEDMPEGEMEPEDDMGKLNKEY